MKTSIATAVIMDIAEQASMVKGDSVRVASSFDQFVSNTCHANMQMTM